MGIPGLRCRGPMLLATTFLVSIDFFGPFEAGAQQSEAVSLETIEIRGEPGGPAGYVATRTSSATKTDTPLRDIPQSITVVTREQIKDTGAQKIEDIARYVPGVNWHQGEGNRDQIVIRGQSSTADFFVNGMRDDAQIYRDLYNTDRVEFLKGPNAMIFGRGGGGGVINRVLKDADGTSIRELTLQGGMFNNKRVSTDLGGKINDNLSARINAVYENSGSYRDYVNLERYGVNPTFTWTPTAATKIKLSFEHFHDQRTADRGIPSQNGAPYFNAASSTFFGNPALSFAPATSNIVMASIEHAFDNGLSVKSQTRFADIKRFYQNVYPGSAVNPATDTLTLSAYNNTNDRQNLINQTDWTYKLSTGPANHTLLVGTEFANQKSANARFSGFFTNGTTTSNPIPASNPVSFEPVDFRGLASDARNRTNLNVAAVYGQDQIEITRFLQLIGGLRFDRFELDYVNLNAQSPAFGQQFGRVDNLVSPRLGLVVKPADPLSFYASYSVSYLPSSGDQFNALTAVSTGLQPEKFINKEIGVKWDIMPALSFSAALFQLDRENTPIRDNSGVVIAAGASRVEGVELSLAGHVTEQWQMTAGYAHLNARFVTDTANAGGTVVARAGNRVPFVPVDTASLWNRYDFTAMWGAGVGVIGQTDYFANADNLVNIPGFVRVDAALFWTLNPQIRAQLNVENVLGAKYYPSADANNNITPGSPRAARLLVTARF
jgi:catecholate siderophore receptor